MLAEQREEWSRRKIKSLSAKRYLNSICSSLRERKLSTFGFRRDERECRKLSRENIKSERPNNSSALQWFTRSWFSCICATRALSFSLFVASARLNLIVGSVFSREENQLDAVKKSVTFQTCCEQELELKRVTKKKKPKTERSFIR